MNSTEFGLAIKEARTRAKLTQRQLAALCQVSVPFISDLENGKTTSQLGKSLYLATQLGLKIRLRR